MNMSGRMRVFSFGWRSANSLNSRRRSAQVRSQVTVSNSARNSRVALPAYSRPQASSAYWPTCRACAVRAAPGTGLLALVMRVDRTPRVAGSFSNLFDNRLLGNLSAVRLAGASYRQSRFAGSPGEFGRLKRCSTSCSESR
jgi:hypothetical protein